MPDVVMTKLVAGAVHRAALELSWAHANTEDGSLERMLGEIRKELGAAERRALAVHKDASLKEGAQLELADDAEG